MSPRDALSYEMPGFPLPGWLWPEPDEPLLDMLLAGQPLPLNAPQGMLALADHLAGLAAPADPGELTGETAVLSAFSRAVFPVGTSPRHRAQARRRRSLTTSRCKLGAMLIAVLIALGSTAAAYAGVLPAALQKLAHRAIDAPAAGQVAIGGPALSQQAGPTRAGPATEHIRHAGMLGHRDHNDRRHLVRPGKSAGRTRYRGQRRPGHGRRKPASHADRRGIGWLAPLIR